MSKWRLWLLKHGVELECEKENWFANGFKRHISIAVNHRYVGFEIRFYPFKGVFDDELNTPHAEIARQYEDGRR